jgi:hypothetical protein
MNRSVAIGLTVFTALCCGLPGLGGICMGAFAFMGAQMPEVMAQNTNTPQDVMLGVALFFCTGLALVIIPVVVGLVSFRLSRPPELDFNEPLPPAS